MKPLPTALALLATLAAVAAILVVLLGEGEPIVPEIEAPLPARDVPGPPATRRLEVPKGGVFAGRVVDEEGRGIAGARVLLVAFDGGDASAFAAAGTDPARFDPSRLAVVGFRTAARTTTDPGGRFRVAADPDSAIRIVVAYHTGHVPRLVGVEAPTEGLAIVLQPAGRLVGRVVDAETGRPVPRANVAIYLQQRVDPIEGGVGTRVQGRGAGRPTSFFAQAQRWVAKELGPAVWGAEWQGDETIRTWTDADGAFAFGPIGDEVQLEVVITHAAYMWTEHDRTPRDTVERTVVRPGETVERTFRLVKGRSISGRVLDENNRPVPDVLVSVDHVAQHTQHWWYRTKPRRARSRRDGSFVVGGLSFGPYTVTLEHPASGRTVVPGVPEGARDLELGVRSRGAVEGTVEGLEDEPLGERATLVLEAVGDVAAGEGRHRREPVTLDAQGRFRVQGIRPGAWNVWLQAGGKSSLPQRVEVGSLETVLLTFELGGGGRIALRVWEAGDRVVDPAMVTLVAVPADGPRRRLGQLVTRGGRLEAEGIAPGRYVAEVSAAGYLSATTEPFEVAVDRVTDAGDVILRRPGALRFADILDADGRPASFRVDLRVREGDGPAKPLLLAARPEVPVKPGLVTVRAEGEDGSVYEETFEVEDGAVVPVVVRLRRP